MTTARDRVLTTFRRRTPDRVPRALEYGSFCPPLRNVFREKTGASDPAEHFQYEIREVAFRPTKRRQGLERYIPRDLPKGASIDWEWGNVVQPGQYAHITQVVHYALSDLQQPSDVEAFPMPDLLAGYRWVHLKEEVAAYHARDLAVCGALSQTIFEVAWGVRGLEDLLVDMLTNPGLAAALMDRIVAMRCQQAGILAEADVDVLRLGDDVATERGMMISPAVWREWLKPRLQQVIRAARAVKPDVLIAYHSDGDCSAVIPELIEIGVDVLNPLQPECLNRSEIKRQYGGDLAFWGGIGVQTTMPFGTPAEVMRDVKECIETVGKNGGLLICPSHFLQPEVPWENVMAFFEAVGRYGAYA